MPVLRDEQLPIATEYDVVIATNRAQVGCGVGV